MPLYSLIQEEPHSSSSAADGRNPSAADGRDPLDRMAEPELAYISGAGGKQNS